MDQSNSTFSRFLSPEMIAKAQAAVDRDLLYQGKSLRAIPPDPITKAELSSITSMNKMGEDFLASSAANMLQDAKLRFPPLERLPCANIEVKKSKICPNPGLRACSACKLVSYCSKDCQNAHWRMHKIDCKNKMKSDEWKPSYITEKRSPSFVTNETTAEGFSAMRNDQFSIGECLWGNIPAIDVINLSENEKDSAKDFSLAFAASGDLRHVMQTINALPSNYSGNLTLIINDRSNVTVRRNILLLLILGTISDKVMAADIALHFWYSVFMPSEYFLQMSAALVSFLKFREENDPGFHIPLGLHSTLSVCIPPQGNKCFTHFISQNISMGEVQDEYDRVRTAPSREDYRGRMYSGLRPSHRVAFHAYRRFGIILPFGAHNAHFNTPNLSLFSFDGTWLQTDYADPLEGWDLNAVIEGGKAHGAQTEDIYGCLYFYLSDQLRLFAERIQQFRISFKVLGFDASILPRVIQNNMLASYGIPASIDFNRIEVSNIMDDNYVGIDGVLTAWAPLLQENRHATILGYFMNWVALFQPDGHVTNAGAGVHKKLIQRLIKEGKCRLPPTNKRQDYQADEIMSNLYRSLDDMQAIYDNSRPFNKFLRDQRLHEILLKAKLTRKKTHTIVPHRIYAPLRGPENALPEFPDDSWYYETQLQSFTWAERFVEFTYRL